jgi:cytochrome c oxidase assembly protein subunit 11
VQPPAKTPERARTTRDIAVAAALVGVFAVMLGAAYAAVPLYKLICQATGINGTTQRVTGNTAGKVLDRTITIHFDANTGGGLAWQFKPDAESVTVHVGETAMAFFNATNTSSRAITGSATYNVTPEIAGLYFNKIQCFCFNQQTLKAGERAEMPVVFYVDPAIMREHGADGIRDITLSYTFFEAPASPAPSVAVTGAPAVKTKGS